MASSFSRKTCKSPRSLLRSTPRAPPVRPTHCSQQVSHSIRTFSSALLWSQPNDVYRFPPRSTLREPPVRATHLSHSRLKQYVSYNPVLLRKFHVTASFQVNASHDWLISATCDQPCRVTSIFLTIQHLKYALFSPRVVEAGPFYTLFAVSRPCYPFFFIIILKPRNE